MSPVIRTYDVALYPFGDEIAKIFGVDQCDLRIVHLKRRDLLPDGPLARSTETLTNFHDLLLRDIALADGSAVRGVYRRFISDVISPLFDGDFVYQTFPTFRLQFPGDMAIHEWHYDSDPSHSHPDWEINFQIPLTEMRGSVATWIESVPGLRDFAPMEMRVGEFAIFDGNRCLHGNRSNATELTRASLDFRVLPLGRYMAQSAAGMSATAGKRFVVGEYYERFHRERTESVRAS